MSDPTFWRNLKNTITLSSLTLICSFPLPIVFALLLNEINNSFCKRFIQTVSYLPHFISTIIVVGMVNQLLSPSTGIINYLLTATGHQSVFFLSKPEWFRPIYILSEIWQTLGWNAIIYIAALSSVDVELYEAAKIDGANRFKQTLNITLPCIMPTIVITFILAVGGLMTVGFEKILLLYNPSTYDTADVISTYVYRIGIVGNNYSFATAIGLFEAVAGVLLITSANLLSKKFSDTSLW